MADQIQQRIKLAEAMRWRWIFGHGTGGYWIAPCGMEKEWTAVEHRHLQLPDPFTDANHDCDVLDWARRNLDDKDYAAAMFAVVEEQGGDIGSSFPVYIKGNYARATCKVLGISE